MQKRVLETQFDLELKKSEIREALFRMQVWNVFDQSVLQLVLARDRKR